MQQPLIRHGGSSSSSRDDAEINVHRGRQEALTFGDRFEKAAALVDLGEDGVGLPEEVFEAPNFEKAAKFYFLFINSSIIWGLNIFSLIVLSFLEIPLWCTRPSSTPCSNRAFYYLGELPYLSSKHCLLYEAITVFVLTIHTFFPIMYMGNRLFWGNKLNILKVISLVLLMSDLVIDALYLSSGPIDYLPFRVAPYVRVIVLVLNVRELRDCIQTLAGMVKVYLDVLALLLLFLLFSSWVAYIMFEDTNQGKLVFTSYGMTLYHMTVLFTTSNNPDVWIPAYKSSRTSCLFFVIYILFGVYFVTNLVLAVVYDSFKAQLANQVAKKDALRENMLGKAFDYLDKERHGVLDRQKCYELFKQLSKYRTLPRFSKDDFDLIFAELDDNNNFQIDKKEFADLCNAISLRFEKEPQPSMFDSYGFYHTSTCNCVREFVKSKTFDYVIIFVLLLNLITVLIETTLDIENNSGQRIWQKVEFVFGWIFVAEMALKTFSYGFDAYWRDGQNRFDFIVIWIIVVGETLSFAFPHGLPLLSNSEWIRYLLIARLLRLTRILMHIPRYNKIMATFLTLIPSLTPYFGLIFCVMCLYCSLGLQLFGGLVYKGNSKLDGNSLQENDYLLFNFNDYPSGMVTLFNLLIMGNWQIWMEGYVPLTGTSWSLVYFISFYLVTVLLMLNLVVAFVLEAFFAAEEMDTDVGSKLTNADTDGKQNCKRRVRSETRSGRVDRLLHHILSNELSQANDSD